MDELIDTSGFYKFDAQQQVWFYGPNAVFGPNYTLLKEDHEYYNYPVDGWNWYSQAPETFVAS